MEIKNANYSYLGTKKLTGSIFSAIANSYRPELSQSEVVRMRAHDYGRVSLVVRSYPAEPEVYYAFTDGGTMTKPATFRTTACAIVDTKTGLMGQGSATCMEGDTFSTKVGRELAYAKAALMLKEKPARLPSVVLARPGYKGALQTSCKLMANLSRKEAIRKRATYIQRQAEKVVMKAEKQLLALKEAQGA